MYKAFIGISVNRYIIVTVHFQHLLANVQQPKAHITLVIQHQADVVMLIHAFQLINALSVTVLFAIIQ